MYCAVCGTNNDDSALHCIQCGARLGAAQPPPPVAVVPVPAAAGTPVAAAIPNYMVQAILMTVCCCLPRGIVCIIKASKVDKLLALQDYAGARLASDENKKLLWIGLGLGAAAALVYFIFAIIGGLANKGSGM